MSNFDIIILEGKTKGVLKMKINENFKGDFSADELEKMGFITECECTGDDTPEYCLDFYFTHPDIEEMKLLQTIHYTEEEFEKFNSDIFYDPDIRCKEGECRFV